MNFSNSGGATWVSTPHEETHGRSEVSSSPSGGLTRSGRSGGPLQQEEADPEAWQSTRAQTQVALDARTYLESEPDDIGRLVADNLYELFVTCDAGPALQQQFEFHCPEFIAIHDVATHSSHQLLAGIASASKGAVKKLVIRRQGYGNTLATLEFMELPTADGKPLRIYSTQADADTTTRHALARTLLGFSALAVVLVGDLPGHSMNSVFKPLHDDMIAGPWPNRNLLLLPLSAANTLVALGMELGRGTGVNVRTTPHVSSPANAWNFISSSWSRLRQELGSMNPSAASLAPAARHETPSRTTPLPLRPMPAVPTRSARNDAVRDPLTRYVQQLSELTGMVSVCLFDVATGHHLMHAGASPGPEDLAMHGSDLMSAMLTTSRTLGLGHALPEAAITLGAHHLVLRAVPRHPGLAVHAVLDKTHANLTLARLQIMRMDAVFDEPAAS